MWTPLSDREVRRSRRNEISGVASRYAGSPGGFTRHLDGETLFTTASYP